jgi:hypothetical protein
MQSCVAEFHPVFDGACVTRLTDGRVRQIAEAELLLSVAGRGGTAPSAAPTEISWLD